MKSLPTLAIAVLALSPVARAQDGVGEDEDDDERVSTTVDTRGRVFQGVGYMSGEGVIEAAGPVTLTRARVVPDVDRGALEIRVPLSVSHRQSLGFALAELDADADLDVDLEVGQVTLNLLGAAYATWRPSWPDPYQPDGSGGLLPSSRRSFAGGGGGAGAWLDLEGGHRLSASWVLTLTDYLDDPSYDALNAPTHVVPGDHVAHDLEASWRTRTDTLRVEVGAKAEHRAYSDQYARDALTGLTHASSSTLPANPFYVKWKAEPFADLRVQPDDGPLTLRAGYGLEVQVDLFQGYYSYTGHHPLLAADLEVGDLEVGWRGEMWLRTYGPDGYAEGTNHPPLDYGDRRAETRTKTGLDVEVHLGEHWSAVVEADLLVRRTNFPNYEPGVFPSTAEYEIAWDYEDVLAVGGVQYAW